MILPLSSGPRTLRPHRDWSNSLSLNFPREKLSFMDLPSSRPATVIRLPVPASVSAILRANSNKDRAAAAALGHKASAAAAVADEDRLSEADSSAHPHSGLSASTSTLGTAETAETELTPPSSALENNVPASQPQDKAAKKKSKQLAADKRKRRREKDRLAKQAVVASATGTEAAQSQAASKAAEDDEEDDGRAAALAQFRGRLDSSSTSSSAAVNVQADAAPVAAPSSAASPPSTSNLLLVPNPVPVWADDLPDDAPIQSHDFATLDQVDFASKGPSAAAAATAPPRERSPAFQSSRRGSRSSLHSTNLSRRSSAQEDRSSRPYSPASSQGGWQEVQSRFGKKPPPPPAPLRSANPYVRQPIAKEPMWRHDKYEEHRAFDDRPRYRPTVAELIARPPEPPWTARSPFPFLFNEPGSRAFVDDRGRRKMTLRISLRPVHDLATSANKRAARARAGVVEVDCFLRVEPPASSAVPPRLADDINIVIKLDFRAAATRIPSAAAAAKRQREAEQRAIEAAAAVELAPAEPEEAVAAPSQPSTEEAPSEAPAREATPVVEAAPVVPEPSVQLGEPVSREAAAPGVPRASEPAPPEDPFAEASAHLRSALMTPSEEHPSGAHIPTVEQQMAAQDQQHAQQHVQPLLPPEGFYPPEGFPTFPVFHEPFIGMDGFTYYFDPATGQSVPGPPLQFAPSFPPPLDMPPSASPVPFFAPRRSHKIEIKAPTPESLAEMRSRPKPSKHRQTASAATRIHPQQLQAPRPMDEGPPEMFIPGSFEVGGSVFFAPPPPFAPAFSGPPPFYMPTGMPPDPAILAMGAGTPDAHPPQPLASPPLGVQAA